jgi:hypothetical protein
MLLRVIVVLVVMVLLASAAQPMRVPIGLALDTVPIGTDEFQILSLSAYQLEDKTGVFVNSLATNKIGKVANLVVRGNYSNIASCLPAPGATSQETIVCQAIWPRAAMLAGVNEIVLWATLANRTVARGSAVRLMRP